MPNPTLETVWNLVDTEQRGALNDVEFIVATYLILAVKEGFPLPKSISPALWSAAARRPPVGATPTSAIPRQYSGPQAQRTSSPLNRAPGTGVPPASSWSITPQEKASYDTLFATVDTQNLGYVGGEQAVNFFRESGLPDPVLSVIWDLANIRKGDTLNRDEFAVAMKLINSQRGKGPNFDLPTTLPAELLPSSQRQFAVSQPTAFPTSSQPQQQATRPVLQQSAVEDLFGLDALTASPAAPSLQQQGTGGSGTAVRPLESDPFSSSKTSSPTSSTFQPPRGFKPFVPTSSFGQTLQSQTTGGSGTSSTAKNRDIKPPSAMDDLLGDNDPEVSKKLTQETSELANMSNQIGQLRTQMQEVQTNKIAAQKELSSTASQRRDMEARLAEFRTRYNEEVKAVKVLQDQLVATRQERQNLEREVAMLEGGSKDLQNQHRQAAIELDNERRTNAALRERISQVNAETARLKPELEDMRSQTRHQKGTVSVNKKQLERSEAERNAIKAEMDQLSKARQETASAGSREASTVTSPALSTASQSTNPFFAKRTTQQSADNAVSPGSFGRSPQAVNRQPFGNIFDAAGPTSQSTAPPPTSFGFASQTGPSLSSSETGPLTPSISPPASSHLDSPRTAEPPEPPESRQLTSGDLPLRPGRQFSESTATSVRVETPVSRLEGPGAETPTAVTAAPSLERLETNKSEGTTGAALFGLKSTSPAASGRPVETDVFRSLQGNVPGAFPPSETSSVKPTFTGGSGFSSGSRENAFPAFGREPSRSGTSGSTKDFEDAFASLPTGSRPPTSGQRANGNLGDAAIERHGREFPPIQSLEDEDDSDLEHGFEDDFTQSSPDQKREGSRLASDVREDLPSPGAQKSPPTYGETVSTGAGAIRDANQFPPQFSGLLPSREDPTTGPQPAQSPSQGQSLFSSNPIVPPPAADPNVSSSDTYHSATSHPSGIPSTSQAPPSQSFDEFADEFDDLEDAKIEDENHGDDDEFTFASAHEEHFDEFNPNFDSPTASKANTLASERTPTNKPPTNFPTTSTVDDAFGKLGDFGQSSSIMSKSTILPAHQPFGGAGVSDNSWDSMMLGTSDDRIEPAPTAGPSPSAALYDNTKPNIQRSLSESSEHDIQQVKNLVSMGFQRSRVVPVLEKYDYDEQKVSADANFIPATPNLMDSPIPEQERLLEPLLRSAPPRLGTIRAARERVATDPFYTPRRPPPPPPSRSLPLQRKPLPPLPAGEPQASKAAKKQEKRDSGEESPSLKRPNILRRMTKKLTRS